MKDEKEVQRFEPEDELLTCRDYYDWQDVMYDDSESTDDSIDPQQKEFLL
jgi:hypothetical protein